MKAPRPSAALERAFLHSVVYASLFEYPVTLTQLREGLIGEAADEPTLARCYAASDLLQATVDYQAGHYFPRGRADLLDIRRRREALSQQLLDSHSNPLAMMTAMPFVRMVALSGSVAHLNADGEADLDVFVITTPGRVWSVTLSTLVIARVFGWRKRLCLNYVVSERSLMVGPADLFCANQIVHLRPVSGIDTYRAFLDSNRFVERFYPNFRPREITPTGRGDACVAPSTSIRALELVLDWTIAPLYERLCRFIYGRHLRRRAHTWRSHDQVRLEAECLKLHTSSHRREVMEKFERAIEDAARTAEAESFRLAGSLPLRVAR